MVRVSFRGFTFPKYSASLFKERFRLFHRLLCLFPRYLNKLAIVAFLPQFESLL